MLLCLNNLATVTALTSSSYAPVRKINMFAEIGVILQGLVAEVYRLFSGPLQKF